jgi:hypothetical protein
VLIISWKAECDKEVFCPIDNIFTPKPLDFRKDAIYPSEIGVVSCTKGFISISRTFIEKSFIGNRHVDVKVKEFVTGYGSRFFLK